MKKQTYSKKLVFVSKGTMKNSSFQRLWQILHRVVATATSFCDRVGGYVHILS